MADNPDCSIRQLRQQILACQKNVTYVPQEIIEKIQRGCELDILLRNNGRINMLRFAGQT